MPAKFFRIPLKVNRNISRLPVHIQTKLIQVFDTIKANPISGFKLKGELSGYYKFRLGDYRIVYKFHPKASLVEIVKIEHRQGVYK